jgi:hypothetical protein
MAACPQEPNLTREQRRALELLASTPYGVIEDLLVHTYELDRDMIVGLVDEGLATARREIIAASDRTTIEVVRIKITDAGERQPNGARGLGRKAKSVSPAEAVHHDGRTNQHVTPLNVSVGRSAHRFVEASCRNNRLTATAR